MTTKYKHIEILNWNIHPFIIYRSILWEKNWRFVTIDVFKKKNVTAKKNKHEKRYTDFEVKRVLWPMRYRISDRRTTWETHVSNMKTTVISVENVLHQHHNISKHRHKNIVTQTFVSMWYVWTIKKQSILLIANNSRSIWNKLYKCDHCGYEATSR